MSQVVVFDTNVLFSAIGWKGKPYDCLELARAGKIDGVTCPELLDELSEKLQSKLSFTPDEAIDTVIDLLSFLRVVSITGLLLISALRMNHIALCVACPRLCVGMGIWLQAWPLRAVAMAPRGSLGAQRSIKAVPADPDDDKTLECATVADATHVVTGDRRHLLPLVSFQGISIVRPIDFLALIAAK